MKRLRKTTSSILQTWTPRFGGLQEVWLYLVLCFLNFLPTNDLYYTLKFCFRSTLIVLVWLNKFIVKGNF